MALDARLINPPTSVQSHPDGVLEIILYTEIVSGSAIRVLLSPDHQLSVVSQIAQQSFYCLRDALDDAIVGPCDRCKNHRLVSVPRPHGSGEETVYCPDCHPRRSPEAVAERYAASVPELTLTHEALRST